MSSGACSCPASPLIFVTWGTIPTLLFLNYFGCHSTGDNSSFHHLPILKWWVWFSLNVTTSKWIFRLWHCINNTSYRNTHTHARTHTQSQKWHNSDSFDVEFPLLLQQWSVLTLFLTIATSLKHEGIRNHICSSLSQEVIIWGFLLVFRFMSTIYISVEKTFSPNKDPTKPGGKSCLNKHETTQTGQTRLKVIPVRLTVRAIKLSLAALKWSPSITPQHPPSPRATATLGSDGSVSNRAGFVWARTRQAVHPQPR